MDPTASSATAGSRCSQQRRLRALGLALALALCLMLSCAIVAASATSTSTSARYAYRSKYESEKQGVASSEQGAPAEGSQRRRGRGPASSSDSALQRLLAGLTREQKEALRQESRQADAKMAKRAQDAKQTDAKDTATDSSSSAGAAAGAGPDFSSVPAFVRGLMACRGVSGLGVGVVQNGRVAYSAGFGVQSARGEPVDADTLFGIGSVSKGFTASLGAILQQEGVFDLDAPVLNYLADYRLIDSSVSNMVTSTDLLTHRTGLASHDSALWLNQDPTRRDKIMNARALKPQNPFRASYIYNNWMVASAGYVIEQVGAAAAAAKGGDGSSTWEDLVRARIFHPLNMSRTCANFSECTHKPNRATPMSYDPDTKKWSDELYEQNYIIDQTAPCGAIVSTANDMSRWALAQLGHAQHVLTDASLFKLHSPQNPGPSSHSLPFWLAGRVSGIAYAYNWWVSQYDSPGLGVQGQKLLWHTGSVWGFEALVVLLPESDLGVVLMANSDSADSMPDQMWYRHIIAWYLLDVALQNPRPTFENVEDACAFPCNILPTLCKAAKEQAEQEEEKNAAIAAAAEAASASVVAGSSSLSASVQLSDYLGTFWNQAYGNVTVRWSSSSSNTSLLMSLGNFPSPDAPTVAPLVYQVYPHAPAATDSFMWPVGRVDPAETLRDTHVTFFRNSANGEVNTLFLDTLDSGSNRYEVLFVKVDGAVPVQAGRVSAAPFQLSPGGPLPASSRTCVSVTTVAAPETLSPLALALTIAGSIVGAVLIAALVFAHSNHKQTEAIRSMLAEPPVAHGAAAAGTSAADYRLLQHRA